MSKKLKKDWELWEKVKKTAKPMHANRATLEDFSQLMDAPSLERPKKKPKLKTVKPAPSKVEPKIQISLLQSIKNLDQPTKRKIAKGRLPIDATIDLHGMTQDEAYGRLLAFVQIAHQMGHRTILVITGKGVAGKGVLRNAVPRWLSEPNFQSYVIGLSESHASHGGSGALYVRIRKPSATSK